MIAMSIFGMLMFASCNKAKEEVKTDVIEEAYPEAEKSSPLYVMSIDGKVLKMESAIVNDTLVVVNMTECNDDVDENIIQKGAVLITKDSEKVLVQTSESSSEIKDCGKKQWVFYATMGSPTDEQPESLEATSLIVVSDYLEYNGVMYK